MRKGLSTLNFSSIVFFVYYHLVKKKQSQLTKWKLSVAKRRSIPFSLLAKTMDKAGEEVRKFG
jgi:hypothetical protein